MAEYESITTRLSPSKPIASYLRQRGKRLQVDFQIGGKRLRKTLSSADKEHAIEEARHLISSFLRNVERSPWGEALVDADGKPKGWLYKLYLSAKHRATKHGKEFSITYKDISVIAMRCGGYCEVTGLALVPSRECRHRANPLQPSLDRINSSMGYVEGNVRIVCYAANLAMGVWGQEVLEKMAVSTVVKMGLRPKPVTNDDLTT